MKICELEKLTTRPASTRHFAHLRNGKPRGKRKKKLEYIIRTEAERGFCFGRISRADARVCDKTAEGI